MSYPCGYEYILGQQQAAALHNIQLIYPTAGYSGLAPPSQSPPVSMLHGKQVMTTGAVSGTGSGPVNIPVTGVTGVTGVPGVTGPAGVVSAQHNKKYRPPHKTEKFTPKPIPPELGNLKTYSNPDILICGNCRELFNDIVDMLEHKKIYCKMRFTCKCDENHRSGCGELKSIEHQSTSTNKGFQEETVSHGKKVHLKCSQCKEVFSQAWDLMLHVQNAHGVNIYKLSEKNSATPGGAINGSSSSSASPSAK